MSTKSKNFALISIHPKHIESIFNGTKRFEYRKRFSTDIEKILIYATAPVNRILGFADVEFILSEKPQSIWNKTRGASGITNAFFREYFSGKQTAYALKLGSIFKFDKPIKLGSYPFCIQPPQSYQFVTETQETWINNQSFHRIIHNPIIFIGGVHGSGKSFIGNQILSKFGYTSISASELIHQSKGEVTDEKVVTQVDANQILLIDALKNFQRCHSQIALDGHFCLINVKGYIERVPDQTFMDIAPSLIIVANPSPEIVQARLSARKTPIRLKSFLSDFMNEEIQYAREISNSLKIPMLEIDSAKGKDDLYKKIALFLKTVRNSVQLSLPSLDI
jgi:adenylate kinase